MENKTDKPYSLQDALWEVAIQNGIATERSNHFTSFCAAYSKMTEMHKMYAAELYKEKATEELRAMLQTSIAELYESRKEMEGLIEIHHLQSQELLSEIERLKESNKELVEALRDTIHRMSKARVILCGKNLDDWQMLNASKYESLVLKSEGDVNKKI